MNNVDRMFNNWKDSNYPLDYSWVRQLKRTCNEKQLRTICKQNIEYFIVPNATKRQVSLASGKLYRYLFL